MLRNEVGLSSHNDYYWWESFINTNQEIYPTLLGGGLSGGFDINVPLVVGTFVFLGHPKSKSPT